MPAHLAINTLPISVEPVKESFLIIGLVASSSPISEAFPVITLSVPFGKPASSAKAAKAKAEYGV